MTRLRPMFGWYGSKWRLAPTYQSPRYDTIIEPFAGGAGYSLLYADRDVRLVDIDPVVVGIWEYLIRTPEAEILRLPLCAPDRSVPGLDALPQEARWLIGMWLGFSLSSPRVTMSKTIARHDRDSSRWSAETRERIARQVGRIRHWSIAQGSYEQIARDIDVTWFVDAPYEIQGKHYVHGSGRIDYCELGRRCQSLQGQVIACENHEATWLPFRYHRRMAGTTTLSGHRRTSVEVVWTSQPDDQGRLALVDTAAESGRETA